jgi:glycosyltransferase involved in cell wall biosynthesis
LDSINQENCELYLIGSGPEEGFLKSLVNDLKLADRVTFISWIERDELMAKFKDASAFLFPSHEGAGMVVAEALSFGLPVICLDNEGPGQFISRENGFAIPMGDYDQTVNGLASAIQELHASPEKRKKMGTAAREQFENFFHWDRRGEQLQKVYADL